MRSLLALFVLTAACGKSASPPPAPPAESETVLPLVSGCGCAYQCGRLLKTLSDSTVEVTHDLQDSATTRATIERWCFDDAGHGSPEKGVPKEATNCLRVFYDQSPCGGECVPSTQYLRCETKGSPKR